MKENQKMIIVIISYYIVFLDFSDLVGCNQSKTLFEDFSCILEIAFKFGGLYIIKIIAESSYDNNSNLTFYFLTFIGLIGLIYIATEMDTSTYNYIIICSVFWFSYAHKKDLKKGNN